jgi:segregation and condensation protein B
MSTGPDTPSEPVEAPAMAAGRAADTAEPLVETLDADQVAEVKAELEAAIPSLDEPLVVPDVADLPPSELRAVVESLLFVATRPLTIERLASCLPGTSEVYLASFLEGLAARYDHENRGWELRRIANGWQLLTRRAHHAWVRQLERKELPTRLSKSALETLAIVAYKQPITRGAVEDIRGVQCGPVLRQLMDLKLVAVVGRNDDQLGRPLLYGTTDSFLTRFGLGAIADLPSKHEFGA